MTDWFARPVLHVTDVDASIRFYVDRLGFSSPWRFDEDGKTFVAQVERQGCALILSSQWPEKVGKGLMFISLNVEPETHEAAVAALDALRTELEAKGAPVKDGRWGYRLLVVDDPDGNQLFFNYPNETASGGVDRDGIFACTKSALQLLASPADLQIQYYPDFVLVADELALDFDHWRSVFLSNFASELAPEQALAFAVIDERFQALSRGGGEYQEQFWTDQGLRDSAEWECIRRMAAQALSLLGWPVESPAANLGVYVKAGRTRQ